VQGKKKSTQTYRLVLYIDVTNVCYWYGVLVFCDTKLDDDRQAAFCRSLRGAGPYDATPEGRCKLRLPNPQIFDISNLNPGGNLVTEADSARLALMKVIIRLLLCRQP
jgi:hypothetical protein